MAAKVRGMYKRQRQMLRNGARAMGKVRALGWPESVTAESLVRRGLLVWQRWSTEDGRGAWYELTPDGWRVARAMERDLQRRRAG